MASPSFYHLALVSALRSQGNLCVVKVHVKVLDYGLEGCEFNPTCGTGGVPQPTPLPRVNLQDVSVEGCVCLSSMTLAIGDV